MDSKIITLITVFILAMGFGIATLVIAKKDYKKFFAIKKHKKYIAIPVFSGIFLIASIVLFGLVMSHESASKASENETSSKTTTGSDSPMDLKKYVKGSCDDLKNSLVGPLHCCTDNDCANTNFKKCVMNEDKTASMCIDCTKLEFQCLGVEDDMLAAVEKECGVACKDVITNKYDV